MGSSELEAALLQSCTRAAPTACPEHLASFMHASLDPSILFAWRIEQPSAMPAARHAQCPVLRAADTHASRCHRHAPCDPQWWKRALLHRVQGTSLAIALAYFQPGRSLLSAHMCLCHVSCLVSRELHVATSLSLVDFQGFSRALKWVVKRAIDRKRPVKSKLPAVAILRRLDLHLFSTPLVTFKPW